MRRQRGFTLLELLVVLAIVALLSAMVPLAFQRVRESAQYRDTVRHMLSDMRQARYRALSEGREIRFRVDLVHRTYGLESRPPTSLPEPLQLRTTVADIELNSDRTAGIRFLPSGGATGGTIEILRPAGGGVRLTVDWLSGGVTQSAVRQ